MLIPNRLKVLVLVFAAVCSLTSSLRAQDADADKAAALLKQGIRQYASLDFKSAQATFLQVDKDYGKNLSEADRKTLDDYLAKVPDALRKQAAARESYAEAEDALRANNLDKARECFARASASEYLDAQTRQDASAQLALVDKRIAAAAAASVKTVTTEPVKVDNPVEVPPVKVEPVPVPVPVITTTAPAEVPVVSADDRAREAQAKALAKAHQMVSAGKVAMANNDIESAVADFKMALALAPDLEEAKKELAKAQELSGTGGETSIVGRIERNRLLSAQIADVEFGKAMKSSAEALASANSAADFDRAAESARLAKTVLEANKHHFGEAEYAQRLTKAEDQARYVTEKRDKWEKGRLQSTINEAAAMESVRRQREEEARLAKVATHTERARALRREQQYDKSLEELEQVLRLDPGNRWAAEQKEVLQQFVVISEEKRLFNVREDETQKQWVDVRRAEIPWYGYIQYPDDWKQITAKRLEGGVAVGESAVDRAARQQLQHRIPKMDFANFPLSDVFNFLREMSGGANIDVKWTTLLAEGIDKNTLIEIHLNDITVEKALKAVLEYVGGAQTQLGYVINDGVVKVSTKTDLNRDTKTEVYDIRDLIFRMRDIAIPDFATNTVSNYGNNNYNTNTNWNTGWGNNYGDNNNGTAPTQTRSEVVADIISLIKDTIDRDSWTALTTVGIREMQGQLVITQTAENHDKILDLLRKLREAQALQINIEVRFLSLSTGFINSIGLDLDLYFNLGSNLGSNLIRDPGTGDITGGQVRDPWTGALIPTKTGTSGWGSGLRGSDLVTPIGVINNTYSPLGFTDMVGKGTGIGTQVLSPALSIGGTFLDDIQVNFLLNATQANANSRTLTAARVTLFNGANALLTLTTDQAYVASLEPVVGDNASAVRPVINTVPTGTSLWVEGTVSADRRYVTISVRPQISNLVALTSYQTPDGSVQLPQIAHQSVETTVSVPDGGTLLLGGQRLANEIENELGVPLVSKIPILNRIFTNRGKMRDEQTLLILVRPKIIIQREEEEKLR